MTKRKNLSCKMLHIDAKKNMSMEEVLKKYSIPDEKTFVDMVAKISTPTKARELRRMFTQNSKLHIPKNAKADEQTLVVPEGKAKEMVITLEETENEGDNNVKPITEHELSLDELRSLEEKLSKECVELECQHEALQKIRMENKKRVTNLRRALEELQRLVSANKENLDKLMANYNEAAESMMSLSHNISSRQAELRTVRERISILEKVTIYVYENGSIDLDNGTLPELEESSVEEQVRTLMQIPESEDLKIKEIKALAKVKILIGLLGNTPYEITFESEKAQIVFEAK